MRQIIKPSNTLKHLAACFVFFILPTIAHADNTAPIVVTIKPLYSLVAHLTEDIEQPVLLLKQMQSPHHYSMRPSERRLLAGARIIVWIGPQMESYLDKVIQQHDTVSISAMQASGLRLLNRRTKNNPQHSTDDTTSDNLDPHIWLSSHNAITISQHINRQLIANDPQNTDQYQENLKRLVEKITRLSNEIKTDLRNNKQPFITYHDAYQYFEDENKLNYIDSISFDEETGVSLKHLRKIKTAIEKNNIQCLLYQLPEPDIIETLSNKTTIKTMALDPLGQDISNNKEAWFEIMRGMATGFKDCLNS